MASSPHGLMSHGIKSHTWLIVSHGIHATHVAQCDPFLFMPSVTLLRCHVASPNLAMCHPTPHASTNVKSRPPRNSTKFDVVAKFLRDYFNGEVCFVIRDLENFRILNRNYYFTLFEKNWNFLGSYSLWIKMSPQPIMRQ